VLLVASSVTPSTSFVLRFGHSKVSFTIASYTRYSGNFLHFGIVFKLSSSMVEIILNLIRMFGMATSHPGHAAVNLANTIGIATDPDMNLSYIESHNFFLEKSLRVNFSISFAKSWPVLRISFP
jgi:hypothetical protein